MQGGPGAHTPHGQEPECGYDDSLKCGCRSCSQQSAHWQVGIGGSTQSQHELAPPVALLVLVCASNSFYSFRVAKSAELARTRKSSFYLPSFF